MQQTTVAAVAAPSGGSGELTQIRFSLLKALIVPVGLQGFSAGGTESRISLTGSDSSVCPVTRTGATAPPAGRNVQ